MYRLAFRHVSSTQTPSDHAEHAWAYRANVHSVAATGVGLGLELGLGVGIGVGVGVGGTANLCKRKSGIRISPPALEPMPGSA